MDKIERARVIIEDKMLKNDPFSQWLGIEIVLFDDQHCELSLLVRPEMCNGFGVAHGGITYSLADSALAFASNADGIKSMSIETSINHIKKVFAGDRLRARAELVEKTQKLGHYIIRIENQEKILVALFKGMVYRTSESWI